MRVFEIKVGVSKEVDFEERATSNSMGKTEPRHLHNRQDNLAYPLDLELDLFFVSTPLMFNVVNGADWHGYALACNFDFEALAAFQRVSKTAKLFHELDDRVILLNISGRLTLHYHHSKAYPAPLSALAVRILQQPLRFAWLGHALVRVSNEPVHTILYRELEFI